MLSWSIETDLILEYRWQIYHVQKRIEGEVAEARYYINRTSFDVNAIEHGWIRLGDNPFKVDASFLYFETEERATTVHRNLLQLEGESFLRSHFVINSQMNIEDKTNAFAPKPVYKQQICFWVAVEKIDNTLEQYKDSNTRFFGTGLGSQYQNIIRDIIRGMCQIHQKGLTHGVLRSNRVMIINARAKFAYISNSGTRETDFTNLRALFQDVLRQGPHTSPELQHFHNSANVNHVADLRKLYFHPLLMSCGERLRLVVWASTRLQYRPIPINHQIRDYATQCGIDSTWIYRVRDVAYMTVLREGLQGREYRDESWDQFLFGRNTIVHINENIRKANDDRRNPRLQLSMERFDKARGGLFGDFATSFDQHRWYLETAMRTNPGSVFELDVDESSGCFRRLFVAFHGCLYGFQFCRPLLFVDGTFLKGRYKGHLLAATSKDGNQGLFPLAFAIVDAENQDNWMWFLSQLLKAVGSGRRLTFVSDRQHGLLDALSVVFPNVHHAYCLNHLKRNLIDKLVGVHTNYKLCLMKILVKCAYAPTVASFQHYMEKLRRIAGNGRVDSMLDGLQNDKWANAFFRGKRYGEMSSNAAESYNNWIGGARELPITCMVDMIRVQIMTQLSDRRAESRRWTTKLCPVMEKKLVDSLELAKSWDVIVASDTVLEVHSSISFYVDIGRQTCSCHEWQLNGFPCCHVVHALRSSGRDVYGFIDPFFHVDCFRESYKESIYPVPSSERFDFDGASSSVIKPPITKKQPGRNKKKRIPSRGENVKQIKCGRCLKYGNHNKKTCKAAI
ncbi:unnamed protein product [Camellia sinensis]